MGVECSPKCGNCLCRTCPIGGKSYTLKEERELNIIKENLVFKNDHWVATYPWKRSPKSLPDNYNYAMKALQRTEKQLSRDTVWKEKYSAQIHDMLDRNAARKLTLKEINSYKGPKHYIAHHAVLKPDSKTTPIRIVFNSSHNYRGHILNDYWSKGPEAFINYLFGILIKFRDNWVGFIGDIKKMYNSVSICELDQHCHRFLWRDVETWRDPDIYVLTTVTMGDRPAGTIATVALYKTAELSEESYPLESKIIKESSYIDDIVDSVRDFEEAKRVTRNINKILQVGNFQMKEWVISGSPKENLSINQSENERVLGIFWNPSEDCFYFKTNFKISKKKDIVKVDGIENDLNIMSDNLTKRIVISQLNGIFDPLGLLTPFTVKGKILMRKLWQLKYDWDTPLCEKLREEWTLFFQDMLEIAKLKFSRCVKPVQAIKNPILVIFSDASEHAFGACAYVRWELQNGTFKSALLTSKTRVSPLKTETI